MSRLDDFSAQWNTTLKLIAAQMKQNPPPLDTLATSVDALEQAVAQAEAVWRAADDTMRRAQLIELEQRRAQAAARLQDAQAQGLDEILKKTKQLKRKLSAPDNNPQKLRRAIETLNEFQAGVTKLIDRREQWVRVSKEHTARLEKIRDELEELEQARQDLAHELEQCRAQAHTRELRQTCLEQARATHELWQTLRGHLASETRATNG